MDVALARPVNVLPPHDALPGGCLYEMKFDGYRALIFRDGDTTSILSRQHKNLTRYFPDLERAAAAIPPGCVVDGEAVIWAAGRLDFEALQRRLSAGNDSLREQVRELPASFVGFDVLCVAGHDARGLPLLERRALLEELATSWTPPLTVSPATTDMNIAARWLEDLRIEGIEGVLAKGQAQPYTARRIWLKYKLWSTVDIVVGAVIGPIERPTEFVAGLPINGSLRIVGRSSPLRTTDSKALAAWLLPPQTGHPWPATVKGTTLDRFNRDASPVTLTRVEPIVVEVSADTSWSGRSFRHALRFQRVRPELTPMEVRLPARFREA